jgi:hypothetical protein
VVAQALRAGEHVGRYDILEEPRELGIGEPDLVERFELLAEIALQRLAVTDVGAVGVLERFQFLDQLGFDLLFCRDMHTHAALTPTPFVLHVAV